MALSVVSLAPAVCLVIAVSFRSTVALPLRSVAKSFFNAATSCDAASSCLRKASFVGCAVDDVVIATGESLASGSAGWCDSSSRRGAGSWMPSESSSYDISYILKAVIASS